MPPLLKSALSSTLSLAVIGALGLATAAPAQAAAQDAATAAVTGLFDRLSADFLPQLASSAALSRQLPTVAITPAESVGLKTAFAHALDAGGPLEGLADQATLGDLEDYVDAADGDGWAFTASQPDASSLTVGFTRVIDRCRPRHPRRERHHQPVHRHAASTSPARSPARSPSSTTRAAKLAVLTKPSMSIATVADLPAGKQLDAGLGILGVRVAGGRARPTTPLQATSRTAGRTRTTTPRARSPTTTRDGRRERRRAGGRRRRHRSGHRDPIRHSHRPSGRRAARQRPGREPPAGRCHHRPQLDAARHVRRPARHLGRPGRRPAVPDPDPARPRRRRCRRRPRRSSACRTPRTATSR